MLLLQRSLQLGCATVCERLESARSIVRFGCERRLRLDTALCQSQEIPLQLLSPFALTLQRHSHGRPAIRRRFPRFRLLADLARPAVICVCFCARCCCAAVRSGRRRLRKPYRCVAVIVQERAPGEEADEEVTLRLLFRRSPGFGRRRDHEEAYRRQEYC